MKIRDKIFTWSYWGSIILFPTLIVVGVLLEILKAEGKISELVVQVGITIPFILLVAFIVIMFFYSIHRLIAGWNRRTIFRNICGILFILGANLMAGYVWYHHDRKDAKKGLEEM